MSLRLFVLAALAVSCAAPTAPTPEVAVIPPASAAPSQAVAPAPTPTPKQVPPVPSSGGSGGDCRARLAACAHPREAQAPRHFGGVKPTAAEDVPDTACICDDCAADADCKSPEKCVAVVTDACRPQFAPRRCTRPDVARPPLRRCEESRIPGVNR